jgi:hypothetical protein
MLNVKRLAIAAVFVTLLLTALVTTQRQLPAQAVPLKWYKGNLHTHTLNSDGDSTPLEVATWYREHGYQFLVLTDHNYLTDIAGLNSFMAASEKFLLIPGEEVTDSFEKKPMHMNAVKLSTRVEPAHGLSMAETIQNNLNLIRKAGALPSLNHPNFHWAISIEDMLAVSGLTHFEVYNGHPQVNNPGGGGSPSLDQMWDALLTAGRRVHGIAVDDAHYFKKYGAEFSNPGRGWVNVRAASLSAESITRALETGDFYSSNGVKLSDVRVGDGVYAIDIDRADWEKTTTSFLGPGGKVLGTSYEKSPRYRLAGEAFVRARVVSSSGATAWTQPYFAAR